MKLYVDLDTRKLVLVPGWTSPVTALSAVRGDVQPLEIRFVQSGAVVAPSGLTDLRVAVKTAGDYDEDPPLALTTSFTASGSGTTTVYSGLLSLTAATVTALVGTAASGAAILEVSWVIGTDVGATPYVPLTIYNSLYQTGDALPVGGATQRTVIYLPSVTALVGGTSTDLDATTTVGVSVPRIYIITLTVGGVLLEETWALVSGTDAAVTGSIVRPTDYNASTNAKVFKRIS